MMSSSKLIRLASLLSAIALLLAFFASCANNEAGKGNIPITDADGNTFYVSKDSRVVCAYGSFAECWVLSGGQLVGVTEDAISERNLELSENVTVVGTVKSVNLELLLSLSPDLVILSADLTAHRQLAKELSDRGIGAALFRVDGFSDYADMMRQFCNINGGDELYKKHVSEVKERIDSIKAAVQIDGEPETVLIMRAYSNGIKIKSDNIAEDIAKELGCVSLAEKYPSLLSDLSLEAIVASDPDIILILTMGDEHEALDYLNGYIESTPAFSSLRAVKNGRLSVLPKELFHYKPNNRWDESYEYLAKLIYPHIFE